MIELTVYGDPAACSSASSRANDGATALGDAETDLDNIRGSASFWDGDAGDALRDKVKTTAGEASELQSRVRKASRALSDFAGELKVVKSAMGHARRRRPLGV
ncbi:MAG: putative T7SS-secreted protein [Marmoricola sp.]